MAPFLGFSRIIPTRFNPPGVKGPCVLFSKVLPMGFVNSVSLAQHIHRRVVSSALKGAVSPNCEIRRDRDFPDSLQFYRVYLDNFDELTLRSKEILSCSQPSLTLLLQEEYERLGVPRNTKKAVDHAEAAELQGAWIDGVAGIAYAKVDKVSKYLRSLIEVLRAGRASQKQLQMLAGGLVYIFSFRRPLMASLNEVWSFIVSFGNDKKSKPLPNRVIAEFLASFFLASISFMDFRQGYDPIVTASDASESGGGLTRSVGMTPKGIQASQAELRGPKTVEENPQGLLVISCFDGIGSLRVALDNLQCSIAGYVSIEHDDQARRVMESAFPSSEFFGDIREVTRENVVEWAAKFPNCSAVLVAGGPPCQGVSKLNASRLGALLDPRSSLVSEMRRLKDIAVDVFSWCPVYSLMESVSSKSVEDRITYSRTIGLLPYEFDSKGISLCKRPRLWWFDWVVKSREGISVYPPKSVHPSDYGCIEACCQVDPGLYLRPGWRQADPSGHFATFTTSQPKKKPGFKPAGLGSCSELDVQKWLEDRYRFPPFSYKYFNGVIHKKKGWRMITIEEREAIMNFPIGYTLHASGKQYRKSYPKEADDIRMTLVGNAWHIGVVSLLLYDLLQCHHLAPPQSVANILQQLQPGSQSNLSSLLFRPAFDRRTPFKTNRSSLELSQQLVSKLSHLVSSKGTDVLLTSSSEPTPRTHRFRQSVPANLWRWSTICGWKWPFNSKSAEHINKLEMLAVYTGLKWRILKQKISHKRVLHLVDSMVSLQILNKGRTSSHKLRAITKKTAALLVSSRVSLVLGHVDTHQNPADRPFRRRLKRKWSSAK